MSIDHVVLALLSEKPRHGYAVRAELEARVGDLGEVGYAQVYGLLARLERQGWVVPSVERHGRRTRKVYSISPTGGRELRSWFSAVRAILRALPLSPGD